MTLSWLNRAGTVGLGWLQGFGRFWYRFIIGDDWTIAATVVAALVVTWLLHTAGVAAWWLPPLAAVAVVGTSLRRVSRVNGSGTGHTIEPAFDVHPRTHSLRD
jgi:hypothetical protein